MSVDALSWAFRLEIPSTAKLVLLSYADRADENGHCTSSNRDTEERTGLTRPAINKATLWLSVHKLLTVTQRYISGRQTSNVYDLAVGECGDAVLRPVKRARRGDATTLQGRGNEVTGGDETSLRGEGKRRFTHRTVSKNPHKEPSTEPMSDHPAIEGVPPLTPVTAQKPLESEFETWWSAYPRKTAKPAAKRAYMTARKKATQEVLLQGVIGYQFSSIPHYQPHPATWLNQERWLDEQVPTSSTGEDPHGVHAWLATFPASHPVHDWEPVAFEDIAGAAGGRPNLAALADWVKDGYLPSSILKVIEECQKRSFTTARSLAFFDSIVRKRAAKWNDAMMEYIRPAA